MRLESCLHSATLRHMTLSIESRDGLQQDNAEGIVLQCPHCQALAHITAIAVPAYAEILAHPPKSVGIVYRCDACNAPIFLRHPIRSITPERIELGVQFEEVERIDERFSYTHLPDDVALLLRETLSCYTHGHYNAFASMCRRTVRCAQQSMSEANRQWMGDQLQDAARIAELDPPNLLVARHVLFGSDGDASPDLPLLEASLAGMLVELIKDLFYQTYVRSGRLRQALKVRRFFSDERSIPAN